MRWPSLRRKPEEGSGESATKTSASTDSTEKKGSPLRIVGIIVVVLIVLGGAGFAVKKFVLKPKSTATVATTTPTAPATVALTTAPAAATATTTAPRSDPADPEMASWSGQVVGANGSDTFYVMKGDAQVEVKLDNTNCPGYGALVPEMQRKALELVNGNVRVEPSSVEHGINRCQGKITLGNGRDAAAVLVGAGWVLPGDNAPDDLKQLAVGAEKARLGMHAEEYQHPPWTNS